MAVAGVEDSTRALVTAAGAVRAGVALAAHVAGPPSLVLVSRAVALSGAETALVAGSVTIAGNAVGLGAAIFTGQSPEAFGTGVAGVTAPVPIRVVVGAVALSGTLQSIRANTAARAGVASATRTLLGALGAEIA